MAANTRVRPRWANGAKAPSGAEMSQLDANLAGLINGDGGGTWNPASALSIGGAGMYALGPWLLVGAGAVCTTPAASGNRYVFGDGDAFELPLAHTGQTISVDVPFGDAVSVRPETFLSSVLGYGTLNSRVPGAQMSIPLRVRNGAVLFSVTVSFIVTDAHVGGVPVLLPKIRVVAMGLDGTKTPLKSAGADPQGYVQVPTPASGSAWHAAGALQTLTYATTGGIGPRIIDRSKYSYALELIEESGANAFATGITAGNAWVGAVMAIHNVTDMRPE